MSTNNVLNNTSPSLTVNGGLTVTAGTTTLTPLASTAATGVVTINNAGVLAEVETGGSGTIFVGTATNPKFLAAGTPGYLLTSQGAGFDPQWFPSGFGLNQYGVVVGNSTGGITSISAGSTGSTLMGTTSDDPSFIGSPSFSGSLTVGSGDLSITSGDLSLTSSSSKIILNYLGSSPSTLTTSALGYINIGYNTTFNRANDSIGIGKNAFKVALSSATSNVCVGSYSGNYISSGTNNTGVGYQSISGAITTGSYNTALGKASVVNTNLTGQTALGIGTGNIGGASWNWSITLGADAGYATGVGNNVLYIGNSTGSGTEKINAAYICGITGRNVTGNPMKVSTANKLGAVSSSARFKENINDMEEDSNKIMNLRPVTFIYKNHEDKQEQYGLIAEEVCNVFPELVCYEKDGTPFSVHYDRLPAILLNEVKKLNSRIEKIERKRKI